MNVFGFLNVFFRIPASFLKVFFRIIGCFLNVFFTNDLRRVIIDGFLKVFF